MEKSITQTLPSFSQLVFKKKKKKENEVCRGNQMKVFVFTLTAQKIGKKRKKNRLLVNFSE